MYHYWCRMLNVWERVFVTCWREKRSLILKCGPWSHCFGIPWGACWGCRFLGSALGLRSGALKGCSPGNLPCSPALRDLGWRVLVDGSMECFTGWLTLWPKPGSRKQEVVMAPPTRTPFLLCWFSFLSLGAEWTSEVVWKSDDLTSFSSTETDQF